jgi:hypothetical protein
VTLLYLRLGVYCRRMYDSIFDKLPIIRELVRPTPTLMLTEGQGGLGCSRTPLGAAYTRIKDGYDLGVWPGAALPFWHYSTTSCKRALRLSCLLQLEMVGGVMGTKLYCEELMQDGQPFIFYPGQWE